MQNLPPGQPQPYPPPNAAEEPAPQPENQSRTEQFKCEECGAELVNMDQRRKHNVFHYGERPLDVYPNTLTARTRQAHLLGRKEPEA